MKNSFSHGNPSTVRANIQTSIIGGNDLVKGEIDDAFNYSTNTALLFPKKGKEIKEKVEYLKMTKEAEMNKIKGSLNTLKDILSFQPSIPYETKDDTSSFIDSEFRFIFSWNDTFFRMDQENTAPESENKVVVVGLSKEDCDKNCLWNENIFDLHKIASEHTTLSTIGANLMDNNTYNLNLKQLSILGF